MRHPAVNTEPSSLEHALERDTQLSPQQRGADMRHHPQNQEPTVLLLVMVLLCCLLLSVLTLSEAGQPPRDSLDVSYIYGVHALCVYNCDLAMFVCIYIYICIYIHT